MTHRVSFALEPKLHPYSPDPDEHLVATDPQSEALLASAQRLQEKTSHLWELHQQVLISPEVKAEQKLKLPSHEHIHGELDDTINKLQHLIDCKYPEVDRIQSLRTNLLQAHTTIVDLISLLAEDQVIAQALALAKTRAGIRRHYQEVIKPNFSLFNKVNFEAYLSEYKQASEEGLRLKSSLKALKPLDPLKQKQHAEALEELERFLFLMQSLYETVDFQKDIAFMKEKKQTISVLPMGTLHEVEPKTPGTKRYRIAGFFES